MVVGIIAIAGLFLGKGSVGPQGPSGPVGATQDTGGENPNGITIGDITYATQSGTIELGENDDSFIPKGTGRQMSIDSVEAFVVATSTSSVVATSTAAYRLYIFSDEYASTTSFSSIPAGQNPNVGPLLPSYTRFYLMDGWLIASSTGSQGSLFSIATTTSMDNQSDWAATSSAGFFLNKTATFGSTTAQGDEAFTFPGIAQNGKIHIVLRQDSANWGGATPFGGGEVGVPTKQATSTDRGFNVRYNIAYHFRAVGRP